KEGVTFGGSAVGSSGEFHPNAQAGISFHRGAASLGCRAIPLSTSRPDMSKNQEGSILQNKLSRRDALRLTAAGALAPAWARGFSFGKHHDDDTQLDELSRRCFGFFVDAVDPET